MLSGEAKKYQFYSLWFARSWFEPKIYHNRGEHANNYATDAIPPTQKLKQNNNNTNPIVRIDVMSFRLNLCTFWSDYMNIKHETFIGVLWYCGSQTKDMAATIDSNSMWIHGTIEPNGTIGSHYIFYSNWQWQHKYHINTHIIVFRILPDTDRKCKMCQRHPSTNSNSTCSSESYD